MHTSVGAVTTNSIFLVHYLLDPPGCRRHFSNWIAVCMYHLRQLVAWVASRRQPDCSRILTTQQLVLVRLVGLPYQLGPQHIENIVERGAIRRIVNVASAILGIGQDILRDGHSSIGNKWPSLPQILSRSTRIVPIWVSIQLLSPGQV